MQGIEEEFDIYLFTSSSNQVSVDLSATVNSSGGTPYAATDIAMPSVSAGKGVGILNLDISGATIGETMTFTISIDYSGNGGTPDSQFWGVGISGVTSTIITIPEPSSLVLFASAFGAILWFRRRK
jgi:hypothetical protein